MSEYTLTTEMVAYAAGCLIAYDNTTKQPIPEAAKAFDRWLDSIKDEFYKEGYKHGVLMERMTHGQPLTGLIREAKAEAWDEGREVGRSECTVWAGHAPKPKRNPYREAVTE